MSSILNKLTFQKKLQNLPNIVFKTKYKINNNDKTEN